MKKLSNQLINFTRVLVKMARKSRISLFSCRKSKHTYKQYQHIAVLGLMKYLRTNYRGVIEQLYCMPEVMKAIGLYQLPHFTTIQKFLKRFNRHMFDRLLSQTVNLFDTGNCTLAIDATGYSSNYASKYYSMRTGKRVTRRSFVYSGIAVDTGNRMIASHRSWKGPGGENSRFQLLVTRASRSLDIGCIVADKAYDCEANHEWVSDAIGSRCIIPVKRGWKNGTVKGYHRIRLAKKFDSKTYHQRELVENVFSVIKRRFGSSMQSRSLGQQNKETGLLCVVYNVYRHVSTMKTLAFWMFSTQPIFIISL